MFHEGHPRFVRAHCLLNPALEGFKWSTHQSLRFPSGAFQGALKSCSFSCIDGDLCADLGNHSLSELTSNGLCRSRSASTDIEFFHDRLNVAAGRRAGDVEALADLLIGETITNQLQHFAFAARE